MAAFNNTKGNDGKGQKGAQGKGQQDTWNYARMPEVKCTTNGRWNYNSSESCKLICEYPKLTTLASGESGLLILPPQTDGSFEFASSAPHVTCT